jgi:hypothetical protein
MFTNKYNGLKYEYCTILKCDMFESAYIIMHKLCTWNVDNTPHSDDGLYAVCR